MKLDKIEKIEISEVDGSTDSQLIGTYTDMYEFHSLLEDHYLTFDSEELLFDNVDIDYDDSNLPGSENTTINLEVLEWEFEEDIDSDIEPEEILVDSSTHEIDIKAKITLK